MKAICFILFTILISLISFISINAVKPEEITNDTISINYNVFTDDINESIIDGFFDGDTTNRDMKGIIFVK